MFTIHFRNDEFIGRKLNAAFKRDIDYTKHACWQTGNLLWALHSYLEYRDGNMLSKFQAELTILNQKGQVTRKMIRLIHQEVFTNTSNERLTALISPKNKQAIKFVKLAGFTREGILRGVDKGEDINIYSILREESIKLWDQSLVRQNHHQFQQPPIRHKQ